MVSQIESLPQADTVVADPDAKRALAVNACANFEMSRRLARGEAGAQRVLDDWLKQKRRNSVRFTLLVDAVRDLETIAEARALEVDVAFDHGKLLTKRRQLVRRAIERCPHHLAQTDEHRQRAGAVLRPNQRGNRVQRVEEEGVLDFQMKGVELCARQLGFEVRLARLQASRAIVRLECAAPDEQQP